MEGDSLIVTSHGFRSEAKDWVKRPKFMALCLDNRTLGKARSKRLTSWQRIKFSPYLGSLGAYIENKCTLKLGIRRATALSQLGIFEMLLLAGVPDFQLGAPQVLK